MRDSSPKCPNGYLYHLIGTPHLPWNKSETAHAPAEGFLLNRSTQKIWNAKDFGIVCIGRQFPYKEEGPSNLLSFLPILRNLLVEEPPSSWRKKMVTIHGHQLLAKLNQESLSPSSTIETIALSDKGSINSVKTGSSVAVNSAKIDRRLAYENKISSEEGLFLTAHIPKLLRR